LVEKTLLSLVGFSVSSNGQTKKCN